jgi:hypothetical protein
MASEDQGSIDLTSIGGIRDTFTHNLELAATIIMAVAAILTAWTGFQSAKWSGVQATSFSEAGANRTESTRFSTQAGQEAQIDITLFTNWLGALQEDIDAGRIEVPPSAAEYEPSSDTLSGFYFERFRDEFKPAVDAWLDTDPFDDPDAPPSPFDMPEYVLESSTMSDELREEAEASAQEARDANQTSDDYVLTTVLSALVIFFAGVSSKLIRPRNRILMIALAVVIFVGTVIRVFSLPIEI